MYSIVYAYIVLTFLRDFYKMSPIIYKSFKNRRTWYFQNKKIMEKLQIILDRKIKNNTKNLAAI